MFILQCHYSIEKSAALIGLGTSNIIFVKSDKIGKMIPAELDRQIYEAKGKVRFDMKYKSK